LLSSAADHLVVECLVVEKPEGGVVGEGVWPVDQKGKKGAEPDSYLTSEITAAFKTFKAQLEQHFTVCAPLPPMVKDID